MAPQYIRCLFAVSPPCPQRLPTVSQSAVSPGGLYSPRGPYGTPPAPPPNDPRIENKQLGSPYTWYCEVAHRSVVAKRLRAQFEQTATAAHFCQANKPLSIEVIWPVPHRAAEAYVFYSIAGKLPSGAIAAGRLGGWTQTHSVINRLGKVVLERERRMVGKCCLDCGKSGHFAKACLADGSDLFMMYPCGHCGATLKINDQGRHTTTVHKGTKRLRGEEAAPSQQFSPLVPVRRRQQDFRRVLVCGHEYTTLTWFFGAKPAQSKIDKVLKSKSCQASALEIRKGDSKTIEAAGFARVPPNQKEILPMRRRLPSHKSVETVCKTVKKGEPVKVRRPGAVATSRGVLWRVSDLQRVVGRAS